VFALNEELDEVRAARAAGAPESEWRARLHRAAQPIEAKRAQHEADLKALAEQWDQAGVEALDSPRRREVLEALRARVLERNYIGNLLAGIDRELAETGLQAAGSGLQEKLDSEIAPSPEARSPKSEARHE
jgi:hypothetical protein